VQSGIVGDLVSFEERAPDDQFNNAEIVHNEIQQTKVAGLVQSQAFAPKQAKLHVLPWVDIRSTQVA
jgi:hypothetical protein